jgi:vancomycin permeability regulator SanA
MRAWIRDRVKLPPTRRGQRRLFQAVLLCAVLGLTPVTWTFLKAGNRVRSVEKVRPTDVAMILGAGVDGDQPSPYLAQRLDVALDLFRAGKVKVLLVTGDGGGSASPRTDAARPHYDETTVMRRYLVERGVPEARIVVDASGFSTWDSCVRAKQVYGVDAATVVTQDFHLRRALALCRAAGLDDVYGVADDSLRRWDDLGPSVYGGVREIFAAIKAVGTMTTKPDPQEKSPPNDAVQRAVAAADGR